MDERIINIPADDVVTLTPEQIREAEFLERFGPTTWLWSNGETTTLRHVSRS